MNKEFKNTVVSILGSTGSIGTQALDVADRLGLRVAALSAGKNIKKLEEQIRRFCPELVAVADRRSAAELKTRVSDLNVHIVAGAQGIKEAAVYKKSSVVLNAIVGFAGLMPTLAAIQAGKTLALANKESLVAAGGIVSRLAREKHVKILPVDSEHSAIFQCLQGCSDHGELKKILLTASGGPFFGMTRKEMAEVTPAQALDHPNWKMGPKITVDSATMMNKGLELMEAMWLFEVPFQKIQIVVQRESIIHSAVEFSDNAIIAQLGTADMRIPIQYALTYPSRCESPAKELDLFSVGNLSFYKPDYENFKCLRICLDAARRGGLVPAAINGADEQAVALFLKGAIGFNDIGDLVEEVASNQEAGNVTLSNIYEVDRRAREEVLSSAKALIRE